MAKAGFEIYQDNAGQWRWRLRATNGQLLANGGEGFASRSNVLRSIRAVKKAAEKGQVIEPATEV
jgi:uncharacterized protein YegP (UPF0339 family)